jgi:hypothetical protein
MSAPTLLGGIGIGTGPTEDLLPTADDLQRLHDEARKMRSPTLDILRREAKQANTSALLMLLISGGPPFTEEEHRLPQEQQMAIGNAALLAICDEIDRRIPIPK